MYLHIVDILSQIYLYIDHYKDMFYTVDILCYWALTRWEIPCKDLDRTIDRFVPCEILLSSGI